VIDVLSVIHVTGDTIDARIPLFCHAQGAAEPRRGQEAEERLRQAHRQALRRQGATAPANVPAGPRIKPRDGIHSFTLDPDRLTLVLSEDGCIVDAACD